MAAKIQTKFPKSGAIRSDDAIRRRAAKRGVSFEEQLKNDLDRAEQARQKRKEAKEQEGERITVNDAEDARRKKKSKKPTAVESASNGVSADVVESNASKKRKRDTFACTSGTANLEAFVTKNSLDAKCVKALGKLTEEQLKVVLKRANKTTVDFSKGSHSLLITAMCKQVRQADKLEALPSWPEQAGPERIEYNRLLRDRYNQHPDALSEVEMERAKVLIARDERKKAKKQSLVRIVHAQQTPEHTKGRGRGKGAGVQGRKGSAGKGVGRGRGNSAS